MALMDENNNMVMPVAPMGNNNSGFGFGGNDSWAWLLLLLLAFNGGWGNGFGNNGNNGAAGMYPWMNQAQQINDGFRDTQISGAINNIQGAVNNGFSEMQNSLCNGFAGVNAGITGAQNALSQQINSNQMAALERSFAAQTANTQGLTALQSQLAQCCCDNRLATANLQSVIQAENCADRAAVSDGVRDILAGQASNTTALLNTISGGIQSIKDQLCQDKIDAKNELIQNLRDQLNMANLAASQNAQTAAILAHNEAQTNSIEQYLAPVPRPAYIVSPPGCNTGFNCNCGG